MSKLKRYRCTVYDRRGFNGECMEEDSQGRYILWQSAQDKIAKLVKKHKRMQDGQKKIMKSLNSGKWVQLTDTTIESLAEQGFDLIVQTQTYQGNLPVEDRVEYFKVKLNK